MVIFTLEQLAGLAIYSFRKNKMRFPMRPISAVIGFFALSFPCQSMVNRVIEKSWFPDSWLSSCVWDRTIAVTEQKTFVLAKTEMLQDEDGCTHYANSETISGSTQALKLFLLDTPLCDDAQLFVFSGAGLKVSCNGKPLAEGRRLPSTGWHVWKVPPSYLQKGINRFIFSGTGTLVIDHSLYPDRSARSLDGGKTWDFDHLGKNNDNGEYLVRLRLARYPDSGTVMSEVVNLASIAADSPVCVDIAKVKQLAFEVAGRSGKSGKLVCEWRAGSTPSYDPSTWSQWMPFQTGKNVDLGTLEGKQPIYVQWRITLKSASHVRSPELAGVKIHGVLELAQHTGNYRKITITRPPSSSFVRSSLPFVYQSPDLRTTALRNRYKLDEVVAAGRSELEKFVLLREWVRSRAPKGWDWGPSMHCPPWDALVILETQKQPIALCMCTHYSTVFVQCALSLGYTARQVILDHHCAAEIWSDQFHKWIFMDTGNSPSPELNCHFENNGIPLNAAEIRDLWKAGRADEIEVVYTPPRKPASGKEISPDQCGFANFRRFAIPLRNNHLGNPVPGELEQGMSEYYCDQYLWWEEQSIPAESPEYGLASARRQDFYWSINEAAIELFETASENTLKVVLNNSVPNFSKYLVSIDGGRWTENQASFEWKLHAGTNILRAKSVNAFGLECPENSVTIEME